MRVEIIPENWDESREAKRGDGTPTIDVCNSCILFFEENGAVPIYLTKRYPRGTVGSTDCAHPPYGYHHYFCDCCGDKLTKENTED